MEYRVKEFCGEYTIQVQKLVGRKKRITQFRKGVMMRKLLLFLIPLVLLGCSYTNHTYYYTAVVTYTDGGVDTLEFSYDGFKGNEVYVALKTQGGMFSNQSSPCLIIGCGFYYNSVACGVRKYELIHKKKVLITD